MLNPEKSEAYIPSEARRMSRAKRDESAGGRGGFGGAVSPIQLGMKVEDF